MISSVLTQQVQEIQTGGANRVDVVGFAEDLLEPGRRKACRYGKRDGRRCRRGGIVLTVATHGAVSQCVRERPTSRAVIARWCRGTAAMSVIRWTAGEVFQAATGGDNRERLAGGQARDGNCQHDRGRTRMPCRGNWRGVQKLHEESVRFFRAQWYSNAVLASGSSFYAAFIVCPGGVLEAPPESHHDGQRTARHRATRAQAGRRASDRRGPVSARSRAQRPAPARIGGKGAAARLACALHKRAIAAEHATPRARGDRRESLARRFAVSARVAVDRRGYRDAGATIHHSPQVKP